MVYTDIDLCIKTAYEAFIARTDCIFICTDFQNSFSLLHNRFSVRSISEQSMRDKKAFELGINPVTKTK